MDEGYIKFQAYRTAAKPLPTAHLQALQHWRQALYQRQLIGVYANGIGYGNISQRWNVKGQFIISGSATGQFPTLQPTHFTIVTNVDIAENTVWCEGPIIASSESMSHAVIYLNCPEVNGVIHVHHAELWEKLLHQVPTTDDGAPYGTPEMAYSIVDLLKTTNLRQAKIFVMSGHPEGIFTFGKSLEEAARVLFQYIET